MLSECPHVLPRLTSQNTATGALSEELHRQEPAHQRGGIPTCNTSRCARPVGAVWACYQYRLSKIASRKEKTNIHHGLLSTQMKRAVTHALSTALRATHRLHCCTHSSHRCSALPAPCVSLCPNTKPFATASFVAKHGASHYRRQQRPLSLALPGSS